MESVIFRHNSKIFQEDNTTLDQNSKSCNCRRKTECPLNGNCLTQNVIYQATVTTTDGKTDSYIGLTANSFKQRWTQHKSSFNNSSKKSETALSQHIWQLKQSKVSHKVD